MTKKDQIIKILIADDHTIFRDGLIKLLSGRKEFKVVGETGSGDGIVGQVEKLQPDILLLDLVMPQMGGMDALRALAEAKSNVRTILLSGAVEGEDISGALESLNEDAFVLERIVVDGGSRDGTQDIARRLGATVIETEKGRGHQISVGVRQSRGDIVLILHGDCRIRAGVLQRIQRALNCKSQYIGGALGMIYQSKTFTKRLLALLNNGRARLTGISFGDQAQFFRKKVLERLGGYPDQMLMEDVELSMRMKESGLTLFVPKGVAVSERRWIKMGFCKNFLRVVMLCLTYLVQRRLEMGNSARKDFYSRYYADS